jgi:hypothetical protein
MAAPTEGQNIKKTLANGEPSTHGAKQNIVNPYISTARIHSDKMRFQPAFGRKKVRIRAENKACAELANRRLQPLGHSTASNSSLRDEAEGILHFAPHSRGAGQPLIPLPASQAGAAAAPHQTPA